jgi:cytochrome oxidase Cu insertion factor (SCO1/SenC/PrrC family)
MNTPSNNNRRLLLLIGGIPVVMILAATWLWYYVMSGKLDLVDVLGTANQGTLIDPPRQLSELPLRAQQGAAEIADAEQSVWTILVPVYGACDEQCTQLLYYTRQIHTAMGKYGPRIQRVMLREEGAPELDETLLQEHPKLKVLYTSTAGFSDVFAGISAPDEEPGYYVVDPAGWMMMYYDRDADGKDIMADLKFLLKNSDG